MNGVTVVIPTVAKRSDLLARAIRSVIAQTEPPDAILVMPDTEGLGASEIRSRGVELVSTEWIAFLDDDDEFMPEHLEHLMAKAKEADADMVFSWFEVTGGGSDPFPSNEHREFDINDPHQTTVTFLVKTEAVLKVGCFRWTDGTDEFDPGQDPQGHRAGEEFRCVIRLANAGYKIAKLDKRTWRWRHHGNNTMGLPSRV